MRRPSLPAELGVIALGGALGAAARYGLDRAFPTEAGDLPWTTLVINVTGAAMLAALLSGGVRVWRHPLDVLLAGTGVLGGFTTFSTYAVHVDRLVADGHPGIGLAYGAGTLAAAVAASHVVRQAVLRGGGG